MRKISLPQNSIVKLPKIGDVTVQAGTINSDNGNIKIDLPQNDTIPLFL